MMATGAAGIALEVGALKPDMSAEKSLKAGEIGYIVTNLKTTRDAKVGDTVTPVGYTCHRTAARLQRRQTFRLRRLLPGEQRELPGAQRRHRKT